MLEERLNYLSTYSMESDIRKSLPYELVIKNYKLKNLGEKYFRGI